MNCRKPIFALLVILMAGITAMAQTSRYGDRNTGRYSDYLYNQVNNERYWQKRAADSIAAEQAWSNTTYANFGYMLENQAEYVGTGYELAPTDIGVMAEFGNSYMIPKKALGGLCKFGIDLTWLDLSYMKYKNSVFVKDLNQFTVGMGIGLSLHVAPCAPLGAALRPLRLMGYGRFVPSYSAMLVKDENDEYDVRGNYMSQYSWGGGIDYKWVGFGVELRTGKASYRMGDDDKRTKVRNTQTRVYITLHI